MGNGQLKPAYNVQISTEDEVITNYTMHQTTADTTTYKEHMDTHNQMYGSYPEEGVADAGYGSEENYTYCKEKQITPYIKYNYFHKEQKKSWRNDPFKSSNFHYNKEQDCYYCPMGQPMRRAYVTHPRTKTGFEQELVHYRAVRCDGCPLRGSCHSSKKERVIQVNHRLNVLKWEARDLLLSERGLEHRSKRPCDVEQTFGNLKWNKKFKRFLLRGLAKVEIEFGLLALSHNIAKLAVKLAQ